MGGSISSKEMISMHYNVSTLSVKSYCMISETFDQVVPTYFEFIIKF